MNASSSSFSFGILLHGGTKTKKIKKSSKIADNIHRALVIALKDSFDKLKQGHDSVDAVEAAVGSMEDSRTFNAGSGSCLTIDGQVEMDASIMNGKDISMGSVGAVRGIKNPIKIARQIMERSDHNVLVGDGAMDFAKTIGIPLERYQPSKKLLRIYDRLKANVQNNWEKNSVLLDNSTKIVNDEYGTVGAVALDKYGNVSSAVSTGGRWLKMNGRLGDSAIVGGGFYADNRTGAACATGNGELIMRLCLCKYACDQMKSKGAALSGEKSISMLTKTFGKNVGGIITIDRSGSFGVSYNTASMPIGYISIREEKPRCFINPRKRIGNL